MVDNESRRICGVHAQEDGLIGAVWLAHDRDADVVEIYDACLFQSEVLAVIAEGLVARGRWIPIAWHKDAEEFSKSLLDRGCNMLPEPSTESEVMAEVASRDILERMQTGRLLVVNRLKNWIDEARFSRIDGKIPRSSHPLQAATRHAFSQLAYAKRQAKRGEKSVNYPSVAII